MKTLFLLVVFYLGKSTAKVSLSEFIPLCDIQDPNLNECVVKSANLLVPHLSKGIKGFGFPPLDPLYVPKMNVGQNGGPVSLELELINTTHVGLSTLKFHSASMDTKRNQWILNGTLPFYSLRGRYVGNGRILLVPVYGNGKANFTFHDTEIAFVLKGALKTGKSDATYMDLTDVRVHFKFGKSNVSLTDLLGGNKMLAERTGKFLSDNSDEVVNGLKGTLEDVYSALYGNLVKRITSSVPYKEIFANA